MNKILLTTALGLALAFAAFSQPAGPKHHVVFEMTQPEGQTWDSLITHVNNMREVLNKEGGVEVEVVFFGPGLNMLRKTNTKYEERLKALADAGVTLSACQNAMRFMKLKTEDLFPFANQVDSGISQIVRRQEQGWAYIKH